MQEVTNQEKIDNNKYQELKKKVTLLEHKCNSLQSQINLELNIVDRLEKHRMEQCPLNIIIGLAILYLLFR